MHFIATILTNLQKWINLAFLTTHRLPLVNKIVYNLEVKLNRSQVLSWGKFLIGWPLSVMSIAFIVKLILEKSNEASINLDQINWIYLIIGVLFFFIYYMFRSFLWQQTLKEKGCKINFKDNTYAFAFSELKRYVPGNIWSFLSRGVQFQNLGVDKKTIGISILADIQLVIIGCVVVSLLAIPWIINSRQELQTELAGIIPLSVFAILIFFISTAVIYTRRYGRSNSNGIVLHSAILLSNFLLPGFEVKSKIKLSILSVITYFSFGVGNYFAFLSIFNNNFQDFLILSSFFVFSLLVGYLSFITPMGLGVREGVVTLGFSKITNTTNAGVIAIFTRIVLILSELLFLLFAFLWKKFSRN